jgi:hypothetical protein
MFTKKEMPLNIKREFYKKINDVVEKEVVDYSAFTKEAWGLDGQNESYYNKTDYNDMISQINSFLNLYKLNPLKQKFLIDNHYYKDDPEFFTLSWIVLRFIFGIHPNGEEINTPEEPFSTDKYILTYICSYGYELNIILVEKK